MGEVEKEVDEQTTEDPTEPAPATKQPTSAPAITDNTPTTDDTPTTVPPSDQVSSNTTLTIVSIMSGLITLGALYFSVRSFLSDHSVRGVLFGIVTVVFMLMFIVTVIQATESFSPVMRYKGAVSVKTPRSCCS